ncbi:zinc finger protein 37-like isoform X2 [Achroia grisella]|uniref:zinc finger protein 37-like isoform X2 n=1 Tax=Achroia grisella TaxID=688607 RepID=UPI0027D25280|nr:zinc finger protein 37-like isoform X2 [Achroia grisella]
MEEINSFCSRYNMCTICLSTERKLHPAIDTTIITDIIKVKFSDTHNVCWECNANVRSIVSFRNKVLKAQAIIRDLLKTSMCKTSIQSLSRLQQNKTENINIMTPETEVTNIPTLDSSTQSYGHTEQEIKPSIEEVTLRMELDIDTPDDREIKVLHIKNESYGEEIELNDIKSENLHDEDIKLEDGTVEDHYGYNEVKTGNNSPISDENEDQNIYIVRYLNEEEMINDRESRRKSSRFSKCTLKCEECVEIYSNKKCLNHHMKKHEKFAGEFLCTICNQRFLLQAELENHRLMHYRTKKLYQLHRRNNHKTRKTCPICKKELGPNTDMKKHMLIHTSVTFECNICNKKYRSESGIRLHRRTAHCEQKMEGAYCAECDVQFKTAYIYRTHLRTSLKHISVEDLKHKCDQCGKRYKSASCLKHHIESIHTKEMIYTCQLCDQAFSTSRRLRVHVRLKHEGKCRPKNKICTICSKAFETKSGLQQHMNAHTGARPFSCSECAATFAQSGALYTHRKLLHDRHKRRKPVQTRTDH